MYMFSESQMTMVNATSFAFSKEVFNEYSQKAKKFTKI